MKDFALSKRSYDRMTGIDVRLIGFAEYVIKRTPVDFGIAWMGGRRTAEEQFALFIKGRSKKDGINKLSKHQQGLAFDFIPFVNGKVKETEWNYAMIISAMLVCAKDLNFKIRSGSNWDGDAEFLTDQKFQDLGHIELMI